MKPKILFVDDEEHILHALRRMLRNKSSDWDLIFASSIEQAKEYVFNEDIDIAVLDIRMQDGNGLNFLKEIKQNSLTGDMDVIILTGLSDITYKRQALDLGAADLLSKPIQHEELVARLKSVLKLRASISELKDRNNQLEEQLVQSQKMELISMLAAGAVHDLNGLLSIISGYSSLLLENGQNCNDAHEDLTLVSQAALRAAGITKQILTFTKNVKVEEENIDLNILITECFNLIRPSIPKQIKLLWEPAQNPCIIKGISTQLYQVVLNLIFNARKAIDFSGMIQISLDLVDEIVQTEFNNWEIKPGPYYQIRVTDTGKGIPPEKIGHIFKPLYTTRQDSGGTGLGLSVVRMIVQNYQGAISVESESGKGTIFSICLPIV